LDEREGGVAVLTFSGHARDLLGMDVKHIAPLLAFFEHEAKSSTKAVVLHAPSSVLGPESMDGVLARHGIPQEGSAQSGKRMDPLDFVREMNVLQRFIAAVRQADSVVIMTLSGRMVLPLFGPPLACDFRIAAEDFALINRMIDYSFMPLGSLPWFLTRAVGRGKARELMMGPAEIGALTAAQLGLVDHVVSKDCLLDAACALATAIAGHPYGNREALKQTSFVSGVSLEEYRKREGELFNRSIARLHLSHYGNQHSNDGE
jgi:enoyl-CoA hydratase/carnithine racemase